MNFTIRIKKIRSVENIEGYWEKEDYLKLLELFDYTDTSNIPENEILDMLLMAISDFEPDEAAETILRYKLASRLKEGQIQNLSHEMLDEKVWEEYQDISLHYTLFNINQILYQAYNGKFPKTLASLIDFELIFERSVNITKEIVLRTISDLLSDQSLLKRLFDDQLDSKQELTDAESIIWELEPVGQNIYQLLTSDYWLNKEDFELDEFSGTLGEEEITQFK